MPAFNINTFRSQLVGDGARPNLFQIQVPLAGIPGVNDPGNQKLTMMAKSAQLPGSTLGMVPLYYMGRELKFAGNRTFTDWTVTIINDEDFLVRNALEQWMNTINANVGNNRNAAALSSLSYQVDGTVTQYGKTNTALKMYNIIGLFPIDVSPIDLDWGSNDSIEEFTVTFAYQWWESTGTTDTSSSLTNPARSIT
jgi:hypothetical protein